MTTGWIVATRDTAIVPVKLLVLFWTYYWPTVLTALLVAGYAVNRRAQLLGAYFAALAILIGVALGRNAALGALELPLYWLITNAAATLLLATFLLRRIRAVGPLVLAFLLMVALGSQALLAVASANEAVLRAIAELGFALGLNAVGVLAAMVLTGMLIFAALGWPVLRAIARRYLQKRSSAQSITVDAVWLLFGVVQSIGLVFEGALWILTGLVAFVAYKLVASLLLRARAGRRKIPPQSLLLLRVFALGRHSELLFDKLRKHWLYGGHISMIAGPDLVSTTVEPHEFLDFLSGRLSRQFVRDERDLRRRLADLDTAPDADGRYRINEFFCHSDTWQVTMERLAVTSDAVLMDLRTFARSNQGCVFELGRLIDAVDLRSVVLLVDASTDRGFLDVTLEGLWKGMAEDSPNRSPGAHVRLFRIERQSESELKALLSTLGGGGPAGAFDSPERAEAGPARRVLDDAVV